MKKKKITFVLLVIFLVTAVFPTAVFAKSENQEIKIVEPRLTYISDAETDLSLTGTTAIVDCWVKGNVLNATKAKVIAELQVKSSATNWIPVAIWTDTQNDFMASVYETKTINLNNTYRVKATYTVWEGSQSETITVFSDELQCKQ